MTDDTFFFSLADDEEVTLSAELEQEPMDAEDEDRSENLLEACSAAEPVSGTPELPANPECAQAGEDGVTEAIETSEPPESAEAQAEPTPVGDLGVQSESVEASGELGASVLEDAQPEEVAEGLGLVVGELPEEQLQDGDAPGSSEEPVPDAPAIGQEKPGAEAEPGHGSAPGLNEEAMPPRGSTKRKLRPCSLPVSELETVIASACGDPETPRTHYIRLHTLLHSLPSAQERGLDEDGAEDEATLRDTSDKETLSEGDTVAAEPPPPRLEEGDPESTTQGLAPQGSTGLANGLAPEGDLQPSTGSESDSSPRQGGDHSCTCDASCCSPSCYSSSCHSPSCYSSSCYSASCYSPSCPHGSRFASHTRFSSLDSAKISESTVFSSQDDDEEENSAFESVPDSMQSPELDQDPGSCAAPWPEELVPPARNSSGAPQGLESPVAGPSSRREG